MPESFLNLFSSLQFLATSPGIPWIMITACDHVKLQFPSRALLNMNPSYFLFYLTDMNSTTLGKSSSIHQVSCFFASKSLCLAFALTPATHLTYQLCMQLPTRSQRERATPPSTSLQNLVSSLRYFVIVRLALALSAEALIPSIRESSQRKLLLTYVLVLVRLPVTWATSRSSALELHLSLFLTVLSCFFPRMFEL